MGDSGVRLRLTLTKSEETDLQAVFSERRGGKEGHGGDKNLTLERLVATWFYDCVIAGDADQKPRAELVRLLKVLRRDGFIASTQRFNGIPISRRMDMASFDLAAAALSNGSFDGDGGDGIVVVRLGTKLLPDLREVATLQKELNHLQGQEVEWKDLQGYALQAFRERLADETEALGVKGLTEERDELYKPPPKDEEKKP